MRKSSLGRQISVRRWLNFVIVIDEFLLFLKLFSTCPPQLPPSSLFDYFQENRDPTAGEEPEKVREFSAMLEETSVMVEQLEKRKRFFHSLSERKIPRLVLPVKRRSSDNRKISATEQVRVMSYR